MTGRIELVPFRPEHAKQILQSAEGCGAASLGGERFDECLNDNMAHGVAYTGVADGVVIGCGGVRLFWPGVGEAWAIYDIAIAAWAKQALRYTRQMLWKIIDEHSMRRVQATARVDFPGAANWLEHCGFEVEAVLHSYTPDHQDAFLYSIVR